MKYIYWTNERSKRGEGNDKGERKRRKSMIKKKGKCNDETKNSIYGTHDPSSLLLCRCVCRASKATESMCTNEFNSYTNIFNSLLLVENFLGELNPVRDTPKLTLKEILT